MAAPKRKNSPWFRHPAGFGWKCQACGVGNSETTYRCKRCKLLRNHTMDDRIRMMERQG